MGDSWLFKIVPVFMGFVFFVVIGCWIFMAIAGLAIFKQVDQKGLKGVLSEVWEGHGNATTSQ